MKVLLIFISIVIIFTPVIVFRRFPPVCNANAKNTYTAILKDRVIGFKFWNTIPFRKKLNIYDWP
jgi:hypothetical protein